MDFSESVDLPAGLEKNWGDLMPGFKVLIGKQASWERSHPLTHDHMQCDRKDRRYAPEHAPILFGHVLREVLDRTERLCCIDPM